MRRNAFPGRQDVLVLLLCIVLLWTSVGSIGGVGRTRAKEFVCRSQLRQWAHVFDSFVQDNEGFFAGEEGQWNGRWWIESLWPYHEAVSLLVCPAAAESSADLPVTHRAWRIEAYTGSFGLNAWACSPFDDLGLWGSDRQWRTPRVWGAENVPVLADMWWVDAWPNATDMPPATEEGVNGTGSSEMGHVCINRHGAAVNILFLDWSVRRVGLKELWGLRWHRSYNPEGPWTRAGGVLPSDWPEWMRQFKDF